MVVVDMVKLMTNKLIQEITREAPKENKEGREDKCPPPLVKEEDGENEDSEEVEDEEDDNLEEPTVVERFDFIDDPGPELDEWRSDIIRNVGERVRETVPHGDIKHLSVLIDEMVTDRWYGALILTTNDTAVLIALIGELVERDLVKIIGARGKEREGTLKERPWTGPTDIAVPVGREELRFEGDRSGVPQLVKIFELEDRTMKAVRYIMREAKDDLAVLVEWFHGEFRGDIGGSIPVDAAIGHKLSRAVWFADPRMAAEEEVVAVDADLLLLFILLEEADLEALVTVECRLELEDVDGLVANDEGVLAITQISGSDEEELLRLDVAHQTTT